MDLSSIAGILEIASRIFSGVKTVVDNGPTLIKTIEDAKPFVRSIVASLTGRNLTDQEIADLEAHLDRLSAELQEPLPPAEPDDI